MLTDNEFGIMAMVMGLADKLGVTPEELEEARSKMTGTLEGYDYADRAAKKYDELRKSKEEDNK